MAVYVYDACRALMDKHRVGLRAAPVYASGDCVWMQVCACV